MCICRLEEQRERQKHHEKMYKPASKHQLEEVWEEDDGLKDEQFDPKTFFFLHGQYIALTFTCIYSSIIALLKIIIIMDFS